MDSTTALPNSSNAEKLPPNVFTNRMAVNPGQSGITIVLLDMLNTPWKDQPYAKAEVIRFLRTLKPADHIGLYTLANSLRVLHDYTADSSELLARLVRSKAKTCRI